MNRELDALVAEKVMGWKRFTYQLRRGVPLVPPGEALHISNICEPPHYSTDLNAAMQAMEKAAGQNDVFMSRIVGDDGKMRWMVEIDGMGTGIADTLAEAMCRASLAALGVGK